jgi:hypothetical protein
MGEIRRSGPMASDTSAILSIHRPVVSNHSGVVGLFCGLERGIFSVEIIASGIVSQLGVTDSCGR